MWAIFRALDRGWTVEEIHELTNIDRWFLTQFAQIVELEHGGVAGRPARHLPTTCCARSSAPGIGDSSIASMLGTDEEAVRVEAARARARGRPTSASTPARRSSSPFTPYMYGTYEKECEADPTPRPKVVILGSGPNRIGQGIEFDYCCCHAAFALREEGFETVMVNCNPETVSTDYDTVDRLYFEPLTFEDVSRSSRASRRPAATSPASCSTAARRR